MPTTQPHCANARGSASSPTPMMLFARLITPDMIVEPRASVPPLSFSPPPGFAAAAAAASSRRWLLRMTLSSTVESETGIAASGAPTALPSEARTVAEALFSEARREADALLSEARAEEEAALLSDARGDSIVLQAMFERATESRASARVASTSLSHQNVLVPKTTPERMLRVAARSAVAARAAARAMSSAAHRPLDGKVVVVCGAGNPPSEGHGIGAWTSIVMARQGATVVSVSNDLLNCETVTGAIEAEGHLNGGMAYTADCTQSAEVKGLVDACVDKYGRVDVLVNAGIHSALPMGFAKMTEEAWARGIDLNLGAHFQLVHSFLPLFLKQERGNIIHFTTIASSVGLGIGNQRHAYAAGKAGAAVLTKRVGVEHAKQGVRGNVVGIGYVTGPLVDRAVAQAVAGGAKTSIEKVTAVRDAYVPRGYQIKPEEVAHTAAFLASDASSAINGTEIYADGGSSGCTYGP